MKWYWGQGERIYVISDKDGIYYKIQRVNKDLPDEEWQIMLLGTCGHRVYICQNAEMLKEYIIKHIGSIPDALYDCLKLYDTDKDAAKLMALMKGDKNEQ